MELKVERAKKSDLPYISLFFKRLFQGAHRYGRENMFVWKIFENIWQMGFINLIKDNNTIVSSTSITPKLLLLNNKKVIAAEIGDTYTETSYQRKGMFTKLINTSRQNAEEAGIQFVYGTPNKQSLPGYLKNANFFEIENLNIRSLTFSLSAKSKFNHLMGSGLPKLFNKVYQIYAQKYIIFRRLFIKEHADWSIDQIDSID